MDRTILDHIDWATQALDRVDPERQPRLRHYLARFIELAEDVGDIDTHAFIDFLERARLQMAFTDDPEVIDAIAAVIEELQQ